MDSSPTFVAPEWVKAEEVDWTAVVKRFELAGSSDGETLSKVDPIASTSSVEPVRDPEGEKTKKEVRQPLLRSLELEAVREALKYQDLDVQPLVQRVKDLAVEGLANHATVPREIVDACKLVMAHDVAIGFRHLLVPLVLSGKKNECELAERLMDSSQSLEMLLDAFAERSELLFPSDDSILFWQRCIFVHKIPSNRMEKIVSDLDCVPPTSTRIAGAVFALTKSNKQTLGPFAPLLLSTLSRLSGVMAAPAKKALQQIIASSEGVK